MDYLWFWFLDITYDRDAGMALGYVSSSQYESWARNNRVRMGPSEIAVLRSIDREYVAFQNGDEKKNTDAPATGLGAELSARAKKVGGR